MSDPVTNVEIEDVLSSIRKLVADDARVAPPAKKSGPARLVLTPAQRVKDEPAPENPSADPAPADDHATKAEVDASVVEKQEYPKDLPIDEVPGDARLADFGEVEGAFPDIEDFEASDLQDDADADWRDDDENDRPWLELGRLIEVEVAAALKDMPASDAADAKDFNDDEQFEADALDTVQDVDLDVAGAAFDKETTPAPFELTDEVAVSESETVAVADVPEDDVPVSPQTLEDKVAALGRLVARETNEFEEERDTANADELTAVSQPMTWHRSASFADEPAVEDAPAVEDSTAIEDAPAVEDETVSNVVRSETAWPAATDAQGMIANPEPEPELDVQAEMPTETQVAVAEPVPTQQPSLQLDEDMLRDLVGDIVRQELQGALGERITRNVRKLVRREIHRMLISQELE